MFFDQPPTNFAPQFTTVACALEYNGRFLMIQRAAGSYAGYWGLPAGKQHAGETIEATAVRELAEETGIVIGPAFLTAVFSRPARYPEFDFWFHMVRARVAERPALHLDGREIATARWLTPAEGLRLRYLPNLDDQLRFLARTRHRPRADRRPVMTAMI